MTSDLKYNAGFTVQHDYDGGMLPVYIGEAIPGSATSDAKWRIQKRTYNGSNRLVSIEWADGQYGFNRIWDDRASYSYS